MTIWEWLTVLLRRWPVLVAGLLCTVCAVWAVHKRPVIYNACGSVHVGSPTTPNGATAWNTTNASLIAATGLITFELQSSLVSQQLRAEGATGTYQAQMHNTGTVEVPAYGEPEMDVCSTSTNPEMALHTSNAVLAEFDTLLRTRETAAHVTPSYFLTESILAPPHPVPETGRPSQAYLGVGVMGVIITLSSAVWLDRYLRRRRRRPIAREYAIRKAAAPAGYGSGSAMPGSPS